MRITAVINDDQIEVYPDRKTGKPVSRRMLSCVDVGEGVKLKQIFEWSAPDDFKPDLGKAIGTRITLDITEIGMFGTRPRLRAIVVPASK